MSPGMKVILPPGTGCHIFSTPRTTKIGLYSNIEAQAWLGDAPGRYPSSRAQTNAEYLWMQQSRGDLKTTRYLTKLIRDKDQEEIRGPARSATVNLEQLGDIGIIPCKPLPIQTPSYNQISSRLFWTRDKKLNHKRGE